MKHFLYLFIVGSLLLISSPVQAQAVKQKHILPDDFGTQSDIQRCGTPELPLEFETWFNSVKDRYQHMLGEDQVYKIPVVIHVIHNGTDPVGYRTNIPYSQAISQISALNRDFNKRNPDTSQTPAPFKPLSANVEIEFCPALVDPLGNPLLEPGVNRINRNQVGFSAAPYTMTYIDNTIKPATIWNVNQYMNIWVVNGINGGSPLLIVAGYATFPNPGSSGLQGLFPPGNPSQSDGIVIARENFGQIGNLGQTHGTTANSFIYGRTAVHEAGHWLGLRHIWGDANCGDDYVADTPTQANFNNGCPTFPKTSCGNAPNGDMFMNYMDYTADPCMNMFSLGQSTRMRTIMQANSIRNSLSSSSRCDNTRAIDMAVEIVKPAANDSTCATTVAPQIKIYNLGTSAITSLRVGYKIDSGTEQTLDLTGTLGSQQVALINLPEISVGAVGNHNLTVTLSNANGGATDNFPSNNSQVVTFKRINPATGGRTLPFLESFTNATFPPTGWSYSVPNDPYKWARRSATGGGGFGLDNAAARMDNFNSNHPIWGQSDILETPSLNLSTLDATGVLLVDIAHAQYDASTEDSLSIHISTDCGASWSKIYGKGGARLATAPPTGLVAFSPTAGQWRRDTVSLATYAGVSHALLRFENTSDWGNFVYLDNINVKNIPVAAAPVADFTLSATSVCVGDTLYLTDASTNAPTSWAWTFSGGTPPNSGVQNPKVVFTSSGTKTITLVSTNGIGPSVLASKTVTVNPLPAVPVISRNGDVLTSSYFSGNQWFKDGIAIPGATFQNYTVTAAGVYSVRHTDANGCKSTSANFIVTSVGIFDHIAKDFSLDISPNPSSGRVTLSLNTQKPGDFSMEIRNMLGQTLEIKALGKVSREHNEVIDLGTYGKGVYFITLSKEGELLTKKVVID
jgi:PKD repeat protein